MLYLATIYGGGNVAFLNIEQVWYVLRIIIAGVCGGIIGLERRNRSKEAGIRTHFIVACASALMMIISKYGFTDMVGADGIRSADGARIAAQVVSGIGFLGAGMIFVHKNTVTGLTTAAGIWATSGVGMAIGGGMYIVGITSSVLIVVAQIILHADRSFFRVSKSKKLTVKEVDTEGYQMFVEHLLKEKGILINDVYIEKNCKTYNYVFILDIPQSVSEESIVSLIDYSCKIGANL